MMQCDCHERYGIEVDSYDMFEELKNFFQKQIEKGVFREIPVEEPFYIGKGASKIIKWYADKWYKCNVCGTLWEFEYPDFPTCGEVRKFERGKYPGPETNY